MNSKIITLLVAILLVSGTALYINLTSNSEEDYYEKENTSLSTEATNEYNCLAEDCLEITTLEYPVGELPLDVQQALATAIEDEYKARATYEAVIEKFGMTRPFSMIIRSEEQHISSLKAIYDKYGLDVPADPYKDVTIANNLIDNCIVGVQAEIDNAALYQDALIPIVKDYTDITNVFTLLMEASQNSHLPAFERCANT